MLEFGMGFINSLQGQKLWERNCCPSQLLSHTPVTLSCGVEFRAQLVPNPRKCLYSLHQIGLLFFWENIYRSQTVNGVAACSGGAWDQAEAQSAMAHRTHGCSLGTRDPQTEGNVCGFSVSTVWAKTLGLNALFRNFRDQVVVSSKVSIAEEV